MGSKFLIRSEEDYHEFNLGFVGGQIRNFKRRYFRKNSKFSARIYAKLFHPIDCPPHWYMRYIVFEVNGKTIDNSPITPEAFDTLTRGKQPDDSYSSIDFYTLEIHNKPQNNN
jgi:hypothetical protein